MWPHPGGLINLWMPHGIVHDAFLKSPRGLIILWVASGWYHLLHLLVWCCFIISYLFLYHSTTFLLLFKIWKINVPTDINAETFIWIIPHIIGDTNNHGSDYEKKAYKCWFLYWKMSWQRSRNSLAWTQHHRRRYKRGHQNQIINSDLWPYSNTHQTI